MFISDKCWEAIRNQFTDLEKDMLRSVKTGETICPRGVSIDSDRLPQDVRERIKFRVRNYNSQFASSKRSRM